MKRKRLSYTACTSLVLILAGFFLINSGKEAMEGMLIFTQVSEEGLGGESRIVALNPDNPQGDVKVLTEGFYSARSPEVSYDGKNLLFSGKVEESDPWQIWNMKLRGLKTRKVSRELEGCRDPAYLPNGEVVFSANVSAPYYQSKDKETHALFTCGLDGSNTRRITFHPPSDLAPTILSDGRLLFVSQSTNSSNPVSRLMSGRLDGTEVELFHHAGSNHRLTGRGRETPSGEVIFIETETGNQLKGSLVSVSMKRPLHSRSDLSSHIEGSFQSASPALDGKFIVSYRPPGALRHGLYTFDPKEKRLGKKIREDSNFDLLDPVFAHPRRKPRSMVSRVDTNKPSGWLYCQNARLTDTHTTQTKPSAGTAVAVEVMGTNGVLGRVDLEEDGSFHIELPGDTPLRFRTIDAEGMEVIGPSDWIWVRPNERRGCVGCHEDRELSPVNRVPMAVTKPPVPLPHSSEPITSGRDSPDSSPGG
jgi:hypothetical protein